MAVRVAKRGEQHRSTEERLRVLLVVHDLFPGAPSVPLYALGCLTNRVKLHTLAFRGGPLESRYRRLGPVDIVPAWGNSIEARWRRRWFLRRLYRSLARFRPQLLYVNSVASLLPTKRLGLPDIPVLLHVHELASYLGVAAAKYGDLFRNWPRSHVAVSQAVVASLINEVGVAADRIRPVYACIEDDVLAVSATRTASDECGKNSFVVGGSGYPSWRKGITLWLQMAAALRRLLPGTALEFRWVGMVGDEWTKTAALEAHLLGISDIVTFAPHTDKPLEEFLKFDVFAMTSWEDPCPLVVLENMALGTPVLCFAGGGGAPEVVGDTGVVVPEFSPEMMASAAAELAKDSARRQTLGKEARRRAERMFVASVQAPKLLEEMERAALGA